MVAKYKGPCSGCAIAAMAAIWVGIRCAESRSGTDCRILSTLSDEIARWLRETGNDENTIKLICRGQCGKSGCNVGEVSAGDGK